MKVHLLVVVLSFLLSWVTLSEAGLQSIHKIESDEEFMTFLESQFQNQNMGIDLNSDVTIPKENLRFPAFSGSFHTEGQKWPYIMVGESPRTGGVSNIPVAIVPVRTIIQGSTAPATSSSSSSVVFNPYYAVENIIQSPIFQSAPFPNQNGQFIDSMQRCAFWNSMDNHHNWHIYLNQPTVLPVWDLTFTSENASLIQAPNGVFIGVLNDSAVSQALQGFLAQNMMNKQTKIAAGTLVIFVTYNVIGTNFLGFRDVYQLPLAPQAYNYLFSPWLEPSLFSTANHEPVGSDIAILTQQLAEWANNPLGTNMIPQWNYELSNDICRNADADNEKRFLEVADPLAENDALNGFMKYYKMNFNGFSYTFHNVVMWEWFTGRRSPSACNGWFSFPNGQVMTEPAQFCAVLPSYSPSSS
jgi:hypothetical protein